MRKLSWLFFLVFFVHSLSISAQKSAIYTHDSKDFDKALLLYNDNQYASAQLIFEKVKSAAANEELISDCSFYIANCAIRTNQSGADVLMERFVTDYPTSRKQNQAYIGVAQYYFAQGNYPQALEWFEKVDENNLSYSARDQYNFQKGYSFFSSKNKRKPRPISIKW